MYLKFLRYNQPSGELRRGRLYSVHFQPNEKGGYNECLTTISDAYEMPVGSTCPLPLIYPAGVRCMNGHMRLAFGLGDRHSVLHLINRAVRERFFALTLSAQRKHEEMRIEVCDARK